MHWSARPFVRILSFYVIGLLLAYHIDSFRGLSSGYLLPVIFVLLALATLVYYKFKSWKFRWVNGAILGFAIILIGLFFTNRHFLKMSFNLTETSRMYIGTIVKQPSISEQSVKTVIKITELADSAFVLPKPVKVMAYFAKDSLSSSLAYGDKLLFSAQLNKPGGSKNPGEFDYGGFLIRSGISAIAYVQNNKWEKLANDAESYVVAIANRARLSVINALIENGLDDREFAVAAAVILGYDDAMDTELEQDYVRAGAMHILCVSGLHVGIVYLVLNFLLGFLRKGRFLIFTKTILLLLFVWAYALLTGMTPSVWRASLMLSLFIVGSAINRSRDPYNTLAAAAVIMLIVDPMLLFNLGFQLSYAAVLGILIFYRPIYSLFYIKNPILDKIWSIVVVSTAAQLGTFPLAAHYFHYLPTYFWLTNIFIFPVSFGIIAIGMLFIMVSWMPLLPQLIGLVLSSFVFIMNYVVGMVKYLPANGIEGLYFPWMKVILVYGLIVTLYYWLLKRNLRFILPTTIILFLLLAFQTLHKYNVLNQNRFIVYNINKHSAIDMIRGDKHVIVMDSLLQNDQSKIDYHIKNGRIEMGLDKTEDINLDDDKQRFDLYYDGEFYSFGDYKCMTIKHAKRFFPGKNIIEVDAVIVQGNSNLKIEDLQQCVNFGLLIIDGSVPYWKRNKIIKSSEKAGIAYYDVAEEGAFIKDF